MSQRLLQLLDLDTLALTTVPAARESGTMRTLTLPSTSCATTLKSATSTTALQIRYGTKHNRRATGCNVVDSSSPEAFDFSNQYAQCWFI